MDDVPDLSSDDESSESSEGEDWQEMEHSDYFTNVKCLFCNNILPSLDECLVHCEKIHNFDLAALKGTLKMDSYSYIKMINFIKINKPPPEYFSDVKEILWDNEKYLTPVDNDPWVMLDFESLLVKPSSPSYHANVENGLVTLSQAHFLELQRTIQSLNEQLRLDESHLHMARDNQAIMEQTMKKVLESGKSSTTSENAGLILNGKVNTPSANIIPIVSPVKQRENVISIVEPTSPDSVIKDTVVKESNTACESSVIVPHSSKEIVKITDPLGPTDGMINGNGGVDCVAKVCLEDDEGYFNTYAHFGIHHDMLSDTVRTESYKNAILGNEDVFRGKTVLDLGCGTGILSMFCAAAGAKQVYAIDQSQIIYHAIDIVLENNLDNVITLIKGKLENTNKKIEKVDVIVSEWMGYFLLFEAMLDSVIYARDNFLKPGGILLPNKCDISLVANSDELTHNRLIDFWSDVYGFKMNCMKTEVVREASVAVVKADHIVSDPFVIQVIDINTCDMNAMDFTSQFNLTITRDCKLTSLVGYFDTFFDLPNKVSFSTGPQVEPTHWKQTVFYFRHCKEVRKGDVIKGTITCKRCQSDVRALTVQINIFDKNYSYILN